MTGREVMGTLCAAACSVSATPSRTQDTGLVNCGSRPHLSLVQLHQIVSGPVERHQTRSVAMDDVRHRGELTESMTDRPTPSRTAKRQGKGH